MTAPERTAATDAVLIMLATFVLALVLLVLWRIFGPDISDVCKEAIR